MELWRVIGAAAVGLGGLMLVLVAMAQARDSAVRARRTRHEGRTARIARAAAIGLGLLAVILALTLTVLPQFVVWALAAAVWLILLALFIVG
jgi:hypothetical protein